MIFFTNYQEIGDSACDILVKTHTFYMLFVHPRTNIHDFSSSPKKSRRNILPQHQNI